MEFPNEMKLFLNSCYQVIVCVFFDEINFIMLYFIHIFHLSYTPLILFNKQTSSIMLIIPLMNYLTSVTFHLGLHWLSNDISAKIRSWWKKILDLEQLIATRSFWILRFLHRFYNFFHTSNCCGAGWRSR